MKDGCWENIAVVRGQCWDLKPKVSAISVVSEKIRAGFEVAVIDFLANVASRFNPVLYLDKFETSREDTTAKKVVGLPAHLRYWKIRPMSAATFCRCLANVR